MPACARGRVRTDLVGKTGRYFDGPARFDLHRGLIFRTFRGVRGRAVHVDITSGHAAQLVALGFTLGSLSTET